MNHAISQNAVERVAEELQKQQPNIILPVAIIRAASEKYRLLAIQVRVGTIQLQPTSQKDTAERRAAALLEYCTRQYLLKDNYVGTEKSQLPPVQLSWAVLAASVHSRSSEPIQQLQHILINFLQPSSFSKAGNRKRPNLGDDSFKNDQSLQSNRYLRQRMQSLNYKDGIGKSNDTTTMAQAVSLRSSTSRAQYAPKILPELVIRLAGYLLDPHGIVKLTSQLLSDIYAYYANDTNCFMKGDTSDSCRYSNVAERRGHLYDLQRYGAAYEAAALYHIATSTYQNNQDSIYEWKEKTGKGQQLKQTKKSKDEALNPEEDDNDAINGIEVDNADEHLNSKERKSCRNLQIDDLMDASNEYTYLEIMQVLPHVQTLAKKLNEVNCSTKNKWKKNDQQCIDRAQRDQHRKETACVSTCIDSHDNGSEEVSEWKRKEKHLDSQVKHSFAGWKEGTLSRAKEHIRIDFSSNNLSDELAVALSANAILQKHGILRFSFKPNS